VHVDLLVVHHGDQVVCLADEDEDVADVDPSTHNIHDEEEVTPILITCGQLSDPLHLEWGGEPVCARGMFLYSTTCWLYNFLGY